MPDTLVIDIRVAREACRSLFIKVLYYNHIRWDKMNFAFERNSASGIRSERAEFRAGGIQGLPWEIQRGAYFGVANLSKLLDFRKKHERFLC